MLIIYYFKTYFKLSLTFCNTDTPHILPQHIRSNQGNSIGAHMKPFGIRFPVITDNEPVRDDAIFINDDTPDLDIAANLDIGKQH